MKENKNLMRIKKSTGSTAKCSAGEILFWQLALESSYLPDTPKIS